MSHLRVGTWRIPQGRLNFTRGTIVLSALCFALTGCSSRKRPVVYDSREARRYFEALSREENSVTHFERRLEDLGAKIQVSTTPGLREATILWSARTTFMPPDARTIHVVYSPERIRAYIVSVEVRP
jgi:hypothetical protein